MAITSKIRKSFEEVNGFPLSQVGTLVKTGCFPNKRKTDRSLEILGRGDPAIENAEEDEENIETVDENNTELVNKLVQYSR